MLIEGYEGMGEKDEEKKAKLCGECRFFMKEKKRSTVPYSPFSIRFGFCTVRRSRFDRCHPSCEMCDITRCKAYEMTDEIRGRIRAGSMKRAKKVLLVELGITFDSISDAARFVGKSHQCVSRCIDPAKNPDGHIMCSGYHFVGIDKNGRII